MRRDSCARQVARPHARGVEEGAARTTGAVDDGLREQHHVLAVVGFIVPYVIDEPGPAAATTHDPVSVAQGADRDRTDGGIQTGDVPAAGQNGYRAFGHVCSPKSIASRKLLPPASIPNRRSTRVSTSRCRARVIPTYSNRRASWISACRFSVDSR